MKITCKVFIQDRTLVDSTFKSQRTPLESTLALCKHGKQNQEFVLIHFSVQNKIETMYQVKDNVQTVLTKYINEGKATIQFKQPAHDFSITGNANELKSFLQQLKLALGNEISPKILQTATLTVQPLVGKYIPVEKLAVLKQTECGFPKELKHLSVFGMPSLSKGILNFMSLRILELSRNGIEYLPMEFNNLKLSSLNLTGNNLWKCRMREWDWMSGTLSQNLRFLYLTSNKLKYIPKQVFSLRFIEELEFGNNEIESIPNGIRKLLLLRKLYVEKNNLTSLPYFMPWMKLHVLDIRDNPFHRFTESLILPSSVRTLFELAAEVIVRAKVSYNSETMPPMLINYFDNLRYCKCGNPCFEKNIKKGLRFIPEFNSWFIYSHEYRFNIKFEICFCSIECLLDYAPFFNESF